PALDARPWDGRAALRRRGYADYFGLDRIRRLGMGRRPVRRRSDRVQETRLRDALRRGQRVVREVRPLLRRHPARADRPGQTFLDLIENSALALAASTS